MKIPQVNNVKANEYIKDICRIAAIVEKISIIHKRGNRLIAETKPKYAWVTFHTCRSSFCTNDFLANTPVDLIMAISGHKTEKYLRRYIKDDKIQKANMIKNI